MNISGQMWIGFLAALCGFICSVAMSCVTYAAGSFFIESLERIRFFDIAKKIMRIIISALQIKVIWKLASAFLKKGTDCGFPIWVTVLLAALLVAANLYLPEKKNIKSVWIILACAIICLVLGNVGMNFLL